MLLIWHILTIAVCVLNVLYWNSLENQWWYCISVLLPSDLCHDLAKCSIFLCPLAYSVWNWLLLRWQDWKMWRRVYWYKKLNAITLNRKVSIWILFLSRNFPLPVASCAGQSFRMKERTPPVKRDPKTRYGCRLQVPVSQECLTAAFKSLSPCFWQWSPSLWLSFLVSLRFPANHLNTGSCKMW